MPLRGSHAGGVTQQRHGTQAQECPGAIFLLTFNLFSPLPPGVHLPKHRWDAILRGGPSYYPLGPGIVNYKDFLP
jgi:hypothetical protein